jgi:hypothetical protein
LVIIKKKAEKNLQLRQRISDSDEEDVVPSITNAKLQKRFKK